ncbi:DMT family transporter [Neisseriaceae bacterium TC5R-5]|nr:DMT family transporter [Neisseriaceae bacterium TC5R-5]
MFAAYANRLWFNIMVTAMAPMIWGSTYIVTTEFLPPSRPFTAALLRALPAGLALIAFCRVLPQRADSGRLLILSVLNIGAFQALLFVAAYRLPGGLAAVVAAMGPLLMMAVTWGMDRVKPSVWAVLAGMLGIVGMGALLFSPSMKWDWLGGLAALAGTLFMTLGTFLTKRWKLNLPVLALTGWQLLLGGLMLAPFAYFVDAPLPVLSTMQLSAYAYLCVAGALLAYALWFRGVVRLPSVAVTSLGLLSPLTAVVLGWVFLGQSLSTLSWLGFSLVLGSVFAVQWFNARVSASQ